MNILLVSNIDGNFAYINEIFKKDNTIDIAISLGDNCLLSESTPYKYFIRNKFTSQVELSKEFNKSGASFLKPFYTLYGETDDPFIPANEMRNANIFPIWQSITDFLAFDSERKKTKYLKFGFLSGYYNMKEFKQNNTRRLKMSREKKSMALCLNDFKSFYNKKLDILFTHDSPLNIPQTGFGCPNISALVNSTLPSFVFYGHYRNFSVTRKGDITYIGMPALAEGYAIFNSFENRLIYHPRNGDELGVFNL
jgi:hypothetical protein